MTRTIVPRAFVILMASLAAITVAPDSRADEAQEVFRKVSPSVVTVIAYDDQGTVVGQGSGVVLDPARVVSNCHVVQDVARLEVIGGTDRRAARWTRADRSRDLCVLEVEGLRGTPVRIRPLAELAVGERVHAVGNPLGFGLSVSSGLVTNFSQIGGERVILSSAPQSPGSSGGGLFDAQGRLIGISTSVLSVGQNLNIALPAEWIPELATRGVAPAPMPSTPGPEPHWIDETAAMVAAGAWQQLEQHALAWQEAQPTAAPAFLNLAVALLNQGRTAEAERAVREALRRDDRMAHAWHYLGIVLHEAGRRDDAERAMDRALELLPASPGVYRARAGWLIEIGQMAQALAQAERAVALEPDNHHNWAILGAARARIGQPDEAIRAYRAALGLSERDDDSRNALARLLAGSRRDAAAHRALVDRGAGRTDAQTWVAIGVADLNRKRYSIAEDAFRKATEASPELAEAWEKLGITLSLMQRDDEAGPALERALELDPKLVEARLRRSALRARHGDLRAALDDAHRVTELAPENPFGWRHYAVHSSAAQDSPTAVAAYRRIDALGKATVEDLAALGDLQGKLDDRSGAQATFARAEALDARNVGLLLNIAAFHSRANDLDQTQHYLERALAVDPRNAVALSSFGYLQMRRGKPEEAVKTLERAVLLDPQLANAWINLGHAYLRNRNIGRAIPALEKGIALAPDALDTHLYIAQAYLAARDAAKALQHAETVLARYPDFAMALAVATLANLMQGREGAAQDGYARLRGVDAQMAGKVREQAMAWGIAGTRGLVE